MTDWQAIRELERELEQSDPDGIWLIHLASLLTSATPAVTRATPAIAAECVINGTHRFATDAEVAEHQEVLEITERFLDARRCRREASQGTAPPTLITIQPWERKNGTTKD